METSNYNALSFAEHMLLDWSHAPITYFIPIVVVAPNGPLVDDDIKHSLLTLPDSSSLDVDNNRSSPSLMQELPAHTEHSSGTLTQGAI